MRLKLSVTGHVTGNGAHAFVCRTRDVSMTGCLLETAEILAPGTNLELNMLDPDTGESVAVQGLVMRATLPTASASATVGVHLEEVGPEWEALVTRAQKRARDTVTMERPARRMRVLVVADDIARRGAMALYVTSGWDVRFASDLAGTREALTGIHIDAVIAEHDLDSGRWAPILEAARTAQPDARRIVRSALEGLSAPPAGKPADLVHRVVDLGAGLEAVLDALTADWGR